MLLQDAGLLPEDSHNSREIKSWPNALKNQIIKTFTRQLNETAASNYLAKHAWPAGLKKTLFKSCKKIVMRFFLVDDSGSMITNDGKRVIKNVGSGISKVLKCMRSISS